MEVEIIKNCCNKMEKLLKKKVESAVSFKKDEKGWKILLDVLERKAVPDTLDLIGRYEVIVDKEGKILEYNQVLVRYRRDRLGIEFKEAEKEGEG